MLNGSIEIFIHYESMCIFYYNLNDPTAEPTRDVQLVSGFLAASLLFFNELGLGSEDRIFRILRGQNELRMSIGEKIHATLFLKDISDLDLKAYYELDVLTRSIIHQFESVYIQEIEDFILRGKFNFEGIDDFIQDEILKMKAHMYSSYFMSILGESINKNVKKKEAKELLIALNSAYADLPLNYSKIEKMHNMVWMTIQNFQREHVTIANIISGTNKKNYQIWKMFQVPMIPDLKFEVEKSK